MIGTSQPVAEAEIPDVNDKGKIVPAHYDSGRKAFWTKNSRGGWIEINEASLRRILRGDGFRFTVREGENASDVDRKLTEIQIEHDVIYAGPLAGHHQGPMECCGRRILVTTSPKLIKGAAGKWPMINALITNLLADERFDQRAYFYAWLKYALEALHSGRTRPGPALVLAGPRNSGKSLAQNLITQLLGGRAAKPYRYMSGRTDFNADLFGAEHLMIEDEAPSTDIRSRRMMGTNIKAICANEFHSCHAKGREALTLAPQWRLSISLNADPEDMMILPPMSNSESDSISDKMILLRAKRAEMPMPSETLNDRYLFRQTLTSELSAFVDFLARWAVPEELRHPRYGVKAWQHPELLLALEELAPEIRLLSLIDAVFFPESKEGTSPVVKALDSWEGTADAMERLLRDSFYGNEAQRLFGWGGAAGTYLGRLAHSRPQRVADARTGDSRNWLLRRAGTADVAHVA